MTSKRCQSLPEVLDAVNRDLETRRRRTNRLMRDIFNKVGVGSRWVIVLNWNLWPVCPVCIYNSSKLLPSLQRMRNRVSNGQISLNHSRTII